MTIEGKLHKIIEAQVKGGCDDYAWHLCSDELHIAQGDGSSVYAYGKGKIYPWGTANSMPDDVLRILLDPKGLEAAYGDKPFSGGFFSVDNDVEFTSKSRWRHAGHEILELWFSGGWKASIEVAFSLLPLS